MKLEGVMVAIVTPFRRDGSVDESALQTHAEWLVGSGVNGLVPCGTTGESPTLSREERRTIIQICQSAAAGKPVSVVPGCGSNSTAASAELIAEAEEMGCDGSLVVTPYYNKPTAAGVLAHYLQLADAATKPILLYHVPGRTNVSIPLDVVAKLFEHPRIAGIKEASGQYSYWLGLAQIAKDTGKTLLAGDDDAHAVLGAYGGQGIISASANALPGPYVQLEKHIREGRWEEAFRLQLRLAPLVRAFFAETNPAPVKYALSLHRGLENTLRLPLVPVTPALEKQITREWDRFFSGYEA